MVNSAYGRIINLDRTSIYVSRLLKFHGNFCYETSYSEYLNVISVDPLEIHEYSLECPPVLFVSCC